jgi:acetophenone carboxylase
MENKRMENKSEMRIRVTEYLDLDLDREQWSCNRCGLGLGPAQENYKRGCLVYDRDPRAVHAPIVEGSYSFAPDPLWVRIVEFYCPGCGTQIETEYLPPGHPITHDIEIDIAALKRRLAQGELVVKDHRLEVAA